MYDLSVSHVDGHMTAVADQVARLSIFVRNLVSCVLLFVGSSRKAYTEVSVNALYKSRAVSSVCKACSAPHIRIADKLCSIVDYRRART